MNMITNYHNYDNGYIGLVNLSFNALPESIRVQDYSLNRKSEFHISLICVKKIALMIDPDKQEQVAAELVTDFISFANSQFLTFFNTSKEFRFVERDERKTVIVMVEVPYLIDFFEMIRKKYQAHLPLQPTHITLYALPLEGGIGILSQEELLRDSDTISLPELESFASGALF